MGYREALLQQKILVIDLKKPKEAYQAFEKNDFAFITFVLNIADGLTKKKDSPARRNEMKCKTFLFDKVMNFAPVDRSIGQEEEGVFKWTIEIPG